MKSNRTWERFDSDTRWNMHESVPVYCSVCFTPFHSVLFSFHGWSEFSIPCVLIGEANRAMENLELEGIWHIFHRLVSIGFRLPFDIYHNIPSIASSSYPLEHLIVMNEVTGSTASPRLPVHQVSPSAVVSMAATVDPTLINETLSPYLNPAELSAALVDAVQRGQLDKLKQLVEVYDYDVNTPDREDCSCTSCIIWLFDCSIDRLIDCLIWNSSIDWLIDWLQWSSGPRWITTCHASNTWWTAEQMWIILAENYVPLLYIGPRSWAIWRRWCVWWITARMPPLWTAMAAARCILHVKGDFPIS